MGLAVHSIETLDNSTFSRTDRVLLANLPAVANAAGGSAGAAVTTAVSANLPAAYTVQVTPSQACFVSVTSKTSSGFSVVLTPTLGSVTLAAGTFDVVVLA
jgi:hypothetical protein